MAFSTLALCVFALTQLILARATGTGQPRRERPTIPTGETLSNSMLVICSPDDGCFSQYGDVVTCEGVDASKRVIFLRTVERPNDPGAFYVYQQFSLPNSLFRPRNFGKVIDEVNARANPAPEANTGAAPVSQPSQPVNLVTAARTSLIAQPVTQAPPTTAPPRTRPPSAGGLGSFTGVKRPVCRIRVIIALAAPFGLCCGPCRY